MGYHTNYRTIPGLRANSTGLASSQFCAAKVASTAGQCVATSAALNSTTAPTTIFGIVQNAPAAYEEVELAVDGIVKMKAATSTIAIGDNVGINSTGLGTDAGTTDNGAFIGRALEAASAANDIISVLITHPGGGRF